MVIDKESKYEDSYEREDRLIRELSEVLNEINKFRIILQKDMLAAKKVPVTLAKIDLEISELNEKYREKISKLDIANTDNELRGIEEQLLAKEKEYNDLAEQEPAIMGDAEGTLAVIKLKTNKMEEIQKELESTRINRERY